MTTNYIKVDSSQRVSPLTSTPSAFSIRGTNIVFKGRYQLKAVYMPVTIYNVSSTNNRISFTDSTGAHAVVIPPGYYTSAQYLAAIGTTMTTASTIYIATRDAIKLSMIVSASNGTFSFTFGTNTKYSAAATMGFAPVNTASASVQTGANLVNLAQNRSFNISINAVTATSDLNGVGYSYVVPITSNTPGVQYYESPNCFHQVISIDKPTRQLDITVYDDNYEILSMYSDWYMILTALDD